MLFFSCPAWKWKTRKQSQHAGCYRCICRAFRIFVLRTHTHRLIEAQECSRTTYWRISPVSVFIFSVCLFFYFPRYKSQTTHARTVRHGSSSFPGQSVNKVSTVSSPPTFTHLNRKRREAKRSNQLTTGGRAAIDRPVEQNMKVSDPQNQAYTNTGHTNSSITPFLIIKISHI